MKKLIILLLFLTFACDDFYYKEIDSGTTDPGSTGSTGSTNNSISAPSSISASESESAWIIVNYSEVSNAEYYQIYNSTSATGSYNYVADSYFTSYRHQATKCVTYYYKAKACNDDGCSDLSTSYDSGMKESFPDGCSK